MSSTHVPISWKFNDGHGAEARVHIGEIENTNRLAFIEPLNTVKGLKDEETRNLHVMMAHRWLDMMRIGLRGVNIAVGHVSWVKADQGGERLSEGIWITLRKGLPGLHGGSLTVVNPEGQRVEIGRVHTFNGLKPLDLNALEKRLDDEEIEVERVPIRYEDMESLLYGRMRTRNTNPLRNTEPQASSSAPQVESEEEDEWNDVLEDVLKNAEVNYAKKKEKASQNSMRRSPFVAMPSIAPQPTGVIEIPINASETTHIRENQTGNSAVRATQDEVPQPAHSEPSHAAPKGRTANSSVPSTSNEPTESVNEDQATQEVEEEVRKDVATNEPLSTPPDEISSSPQSLDLTESSAPSEQPPNSEDPDQPDRSSAPGQATPTAPKSMTSWLQVAKSPTKTAPTKNTETVKSTAPAKKTARGTKRA